MIEEAKRALVQLLSYTVSKLWSAFRDLIPIILVVSFFQLAVLKQPFPNLNEIIVGGFLVVLGLMLFIQGLELGLFPLGETLAEALAQKGSVFWLITFAFLLGFSTTIAEPALIAIADEASRIASESNFIENTESAKRKYSLGLRFTVALAVGVAIVVGVIRIFKGWPLYYIIIGGYVVVMLMTIFAPNEIIGLAYDAGGVTTSTITVPLVTALGVGLASVIKGRNPLLDGFGLIALATLFPMIFVLVYGMIIF